MEQDDAIRMLGITKYFGNFCALDNVSFSVKRGEIHALLGENGAGKTTLMNILYGLIPCDSGEITVGGKHMHMRSPAGAIRAGIGMVHQHFMLVENFTVAENIILGRETTSFLGFLDRTRARREVREISERYGLKVDPDAVISDISVGMQQRVEILKALYRGAEILILDEPTAVLTPQEIDELGGILRELTASGKTVVIITHKLNEIMKMADCCTVINRGRYIDTVNVSETNENSLAEMMVGRKVSLRVTKTEACPGDPVLEISDLHVRDARGVERVRGLELTVRSGEILGIAGVDGNGQKELVEAITNLRKADSGSIRVNGREIVNRDPARTLKAGAAAIHEDRIKRGLVGAFTVAENLILERYAEPEYSRHGILKEKQILENARQQIARNDIRPEGCEELPAGSLSGGNQQKVIIAREVAGDPDLLIAVQPTRGLDVGAIESVHRKLIEQRDSGRAVLLISFELDEVLSVSDTVGVIFEGRIVYTAKTADTDEQTIGLKMTGGAKES